ncbi:MAG: BtpA/SgcQ family protein [Planctomycetota bacterium]
MTPYPPRPVSDILGRDRAIVAMVHLPPLPGSPRAAMAAKDIARAAAEEARVLVAEGFDAVLIENMHDAPYLARAVGPETVAAFTRAACEVRAAVSVPLGVQVLAGANTAALAVALAADCGFIRAEGFVFAAVADEGLLATADAGPLLRYRRSLGAAAERIAVFCDIKKKHSSNAITSDTSLADHAHAAEFFGADGVVVTGTATGVATPVADLSAARKGCRLPVLAGSGATAGSVREVLAHADAVIVGSDLKQDGAWWKPLDRARIAAFVRAARG